MFKLPTSFHSSMVRDFKDFYYGEVQHAAPFPYPHKGLITEDGFNHLVACVEAAKDAFGSGIGLALDAGPGYLPHDALRFAKALEHLHLLWIEDMITGDYVPYVNPDVYREVTPHTTTPIHTGEQIYLRQNYKALIETHAVDVVGPDPCDVGGIAELKWIAEYADLHGIAMAPHGTANGIFGLAALIQVCATIPDNFIAFEYPARFEPFWYDITEGFDGDAGGGRADRGERPAGAGGEFDREGSAEAVDGGGRGLFRLGARGPASWFDTLTMRSPLASESKGPHPEPVEGGGRTNGRDPVASPLRVFA